MQRRSRSKAFLVLSSVLALLAAPGVGGSQEPQVAADKPGGLRLVNRGSQPITVEIRAARDGDCATASPARLQVIAPQAAVVIHSSRPLCIRREATGARTMRNQRAWERKAPARGQVEEVIL